MEMKGYKNKYRIKQIALQQISKVMLDRLFPATLSSKSVDNGLMTACMRRHDTI